MRKFITVSVSAAALLATVTLSTAQADDKDVVLDKRGQAIMDARGNCVRTKWMGDSDVCGGAPQQAAPAPHTMPKAPIASAMLSREDRTIYFGFDKSMLDGEAKSKLDTLVKVVKDSKEVVRGKIVGYADRIGSEDYNLKLSQKRALAVRDYLNAKGLDTRIAKTRALGESAPVTNCKDKNKSKLVSCLARDRRVEVELEFYTK